MNRVVSLGAALAIAAATASARGAMSNATGAPLGSAAPAFTAKTLEGRTVSNKNYDGKVLVLNFWATWCPPCRNETADLVRAYHQLHASDVAFLGIDTTETAPVVQTFVSAKGVPFTTGLAGPDVYNRYGIAYIPTTIVVDQHGVVRARWTGGVSPEQLKAYIDGARSGSNVMFTTAEQRKLDDMLDTNQFSFTGDSAAIAKTVADAQARIKAVDAYTSQLDSGPSIRYDNERTSLEEGKLYVVTGKAYLSIATTSGDKINANKMLATGYGDLNRWADAAAADKAALMESPRDPALTSALERTYYRLHDYAEMEAVTRDWIALAPDDPDAYEELGLALQRARHFKESVEPYVKSIEMYKAKAKAEPIGPTGELVTDVADESMDLGDVYVSLGDAANARKTFDQAVKYAAMIPPNSPYKAMRQRTIDRSVEAMVAVAITNHQGTTISLTKWTGADLPGSLKSTYKYRLIVVAPANKNVTLATTGVHAGWVASFCADGLCSPKTVSFVTPATGVKTYEFQLVPPQDGAAPGKVMVTAGSSATAAIP